MRRTRIAFLMLAAIGGCTPLAYDQRFQPDNNNLPTTTVVSNPKTPAPPPVPAQWAQATAEQPSLAERSSDTSAQTSVLTATTGPNNTVKTTVGKSGGIAPLPSQPTATADPVGDVKSFLNKNTGIQQASLTEAKCDKPNCAEHNAADVDPKSISSMPPIMGVANNAVDLPGVPVAQQPVFRMVNTKKFNLGFKVDDVGITGIAGVDLWCTQDMRTWKKFESVQQLASALQVEVKDEGTYGFTLVARNGNGLGKSPPQAGELPQVWVCVNTTPPAVTLAGVEMSLTSKTPSLIIRWTAKDRNFGPRPVTLSYSASADGPWTLLATNVENTGRYEWPLPSCNVPGSMYLRVQAADLNGNVGFAQTEAPIHLDCFAAKPEAPPEPARPATPTPPAADPARPSATILNVEPQQ